MSSLSQTCQLNKTWTSLVVYCYIIDRWWLKHSQYSLFFSFSYMDSQLQKQMYFPIYRYTVCVHLFAFDYLWANSCLFLLFPFFHLVTYVTLRKLNVVGNLSISRWFKVHHITFLTKWQILFGGLSQLKVVNFANFIFNLPIIVSTVC